jgi:hypothetical protein
LCPSPIRDESLDLSYSSRSAASASPPIIISSQPETVPDSPPQETQYSASGKSLADESRRSVPISSALNRKTVGINTKNRASIVCFPPICNPEIAVNSHYSSSMITSVFPISPSASTPNSPDESRCQASYPSPIAEDYMQSLDLSSHFILTSLSPMFEGTYSDVYKGNWQGQEAGALLLWLVGT